MRVVVTNREQKRFVGPKSRNEGTRCGPTARRGRGLSGFRELKGRFLDARGGQPPDLRSPVVPHVLQKGLPLMSTSTYAAGRGRLRTASAFLAFWSTTIFVGHRWPVRQRPLRLHGHQSRRWVQTTRSIGDSWAATIHLPRIPQVSCRLWVLHSRSPRPKPRHSCKQGGLIYHGDFTPGDHLITTNDQSNNPNFIVLQQGLFLAAGAQIEADAQGPFAAHITAFDALGGSGQFYCHRTRIPQDRAPDSLPFWVSSAWTIHPSHVGFDITAARGTVLSLL